MSGRPAAPRPPKQHLPPLCGELWNRRRDGKRVAAVPYGSTLVSVAMSHGPCEVNQSFTCGKSRCTLSSGSSHSACNLEQVTWLPQVDRLWN